MTNPQLSQQIKSLAIELGFDACGIAKADYLAEDAAYLHDWLQKGKHGEMGYMANHFEKRVDPSLLVDGAKSVIVLLMNYYPSELQNPALPQIAKYAYGQDYHEVIRAKLNTLLASTNQLGHDTIISGRGFTDSAPVLERQWAVRAGLGWIGKNGMLINPSLGSFCFIAELIVNIELDYDKAQPDRCGVCSKCLKACPTQALEAPHQLNASRCISYLTIEKKGAIDVEFGPLLSNRIYGCDICLDVCPWNRYPKAHKQAEFAANKTLIELDQAAWQKMSGEEFNSLCSHSPLKRTGLDKLKENLKNL